MIKIEVDNIEEIKKAHLDGLKFIIESRLKFYLLAFKIINRDTTVSLKDLNDFSNLQTETKTALLQRLCAKSKKICKKIDYNKIQNRRILKNDFYLMRVNFISLINNLLSSNIIKEILISEPQQLLNINGILIPNLTPEIKYFLEGIFNYGYFSNKDSISYSAYELTENLKVNTCCYCNRSFTNTIKSKAGKKIIRPCLDHYFSQKQYPLLSLSLFNLIPSCYHCNSQLKHDKEFTLTDNIHPWIEGFDDDVTFDYKQKGFHTDKLHPSNYEIVIRRNMLISNPKYLKVFGDSINQNAGNARIFQIQEVYKGHGDIVGEIVLKMDKYSRYYAKSIKRMMGAGLPIDDAEFYRFYFANYINDKDIIKRPMAKLTKDLVKKYLPEIIS